MLKEKKNGMWRNWKKLHPLHPIIPNVAIAHKNNFFEMLILVFEIRAEFPVITLVPIEKNFMN